MTMETTYLVMIDYSIEDIRPVAAFPTEARAEEYIDAHDPEWGVLAVEEIPFDDMDADHDI